MSAIACAWVASITVGNQTAKQLLQFYASHNFGKPGFEFKNSTLAKQLEVKERAIQRAHKFLLDKGLIIKEERFSKEGRQLTNTFYLNVPQEFVDNYMGESEHSSPPKGGEGVLKTPLGVSVGRGEGVLKTPLINNNNNNNNNINNKKDKICATESVAQTHFKEFWDIYPRKKDKKRTEQIWSKNKLDDKADEIIKDVKERILNDRAWKDINFIPHPSTYLKFERWSDEITLPAVKKDEKFNAAQYALEGIKERIKENPEAVKEAMKWF